MELSIIWLKSEDALLLENPKQYFLEAKVIFPIENLKLFVFSVVAGGCVSFTVYQPTKHLELILHFDVSSTPTHSV